MHKEKHVMVSEESGKCAWAWCVIVRVERPFIPFYVCASLFYVPITHKPNHTFTITHTFKQLCVKQQLPLPTM